MNVWVLFSLELRRRLNMTNKGFHCEERLRHGSLCCFLLGIMSLWLFATTVQAQLNNTDSDNTSNGIVTFDDYNVHYSIINSEFIPAEVAAIYGIKRSARQGLLIIAVVPNGQTYNGIDVLIGGHVHNMLQQQASLNFKPIQEQNTTYYIAPFKFSHRELLHFTVYINADTDEYSNTLKFRHALYTKGLD